MKTLHEQIELMRAVVALAAADGKITRSEMGLLTSLATRIGIGEVSLNALIEQAMEQPEKRDELFGYAMSDPELAMELLVGAARIDGEIADAERELLSDIMSMLEIPVDKFGEIYQRGIQRADELRNARQRGK